MILNHKELIELFSHEGRKFYSFIRKTAGYGPGSLKAFRLAFVHRSIQTEQNNERLEYLGDAIIETVVSLVLYERYPEGREGMMSKLRSRMVCRTRLNEVAQDLGFVEHIRLVKPLNMSVSHIPGDVLEAFVAAIYLDGGMSKAERFVRRHIANDERIRQAESDEDEQNYKTDLVSLGEQIGVEILFDTRRIDTGRVMSDADNFVSDAKANGEVIGTGRGRSKKVAEQMAAQSVLAGIQAGTLSLVREADKSDVEACQSAD